MRTVEANPIEKIQSELRAAVPEGIPEIIKKLKAHLAEGSESHRLVLALEARFNEVNKQRFRDVISDEDLRREYNRIRVDLMDLIDQLTPENMAAAKPKTAPTDSGTGCILYKIPHKMELQKLTRCVVRVANEEDVIIENIELDKNVQVKPVRISDVMQVALLDPSEEYFEVRSVNDPVQIVYPTDYTQWIFYVKPLKPGSHPLMLKVSVIELIHNKERKHELVFEERIEILAKAPPEVVEEPFRPAHFTFTLGNESQATYRQLVPVHLKAKAQRYAVALFGFVGTVALAMIAWQYFDDRPDPSPTDIDPPTELPAPSPSPTEQDEWKILTCDTCHTCDPERRDAMLDFLESYPHSMHRDSLKSILNEWSTDPCWPKGPNGPFPPPPPPPPPPKPEPEPRPLPYDCTWCPPNNLSDLPEWGDWQAAFDCDRPECYKRYLENQGNTQFREDAKRRWDELVSQAIPDKAQDKRLHPHMVRVHGGEFSMGCTTEQGNDCLPWEKPGHRVSEFDFDIDRYEVTNEQYADFLNQYGSRRILRGIFKGKIMVSEHPWGIRYKRGKWMPQRGFERHPVVNVTWFGANEYARFYGLRLPTEAEWEYAARGGALSKSFKFAGGNTLDEVAWHVGNSGKKTHPVGEKRPNELGIYDLSGNAKEWCLDDLLEYFDNKIPLGNPRGDAYDFKRSIRGGSWKTEAGACRVSSRMFLNASFRYDDYGFRCIRVVEQQ